MQAKEADFAYFKMHPRNTLTPMQRKRYDQLCAEQDAQAVALGRGRGIFPDEDMTDNEKREMADKLEALAEIFRGDCDDMET